MKKLRINGSDVLLDKKTAIGITLQGGDISEVDKKRFTVSNKFKIPKVKQNKLVFEFAESPFSCSDMPYNTVTVDYWDNNIHLINNGKGFLSETNDYYNLVVIPDGDVIDVLKEKNFRELMRDNNTPISGGYASFSLMMNDIFNNNPGGYTANLVQLETDVYPTIAYDSNPIDGHISIRLSKVFEWIENLTGFTLINSGTLTDDSIFNTTSIPFYDIIPFAFFGANWNLYLYDDAAITALYTTIKINPEFAYYGEKTAMDFLKAVAVQFCCIIDINQNDMTIKFHRFNDIATTSTIQNWTGKVIKATKKFSIGKYAKSNIINYLHDDDVSSDLGQVLFTCNNNNLSAENKSTLNVMICRSSLYFTNTMWHLGSTNSAITSMTSKPLVEFMFFVDVAQAGTPFLKGSYESALGVVSTVTLNCKIMNVAFFDFNSEYDEIENMLTNPVAYDADMNLTGLDIHEFKPNNLYRINELGGVFYVNVIKGYNSQSKKGTKVELFKISN